MKYEKDYLLLLEYFTEDIIIPLNEAYQGLSKGEKAKIDELLKSKSIFSKIKDLVKNQSR